MTTMQRAFPAPVIPKFFTNNVCGNYQLRRFFNGQDDFICAQGPFRTQTVASQSEEGAAASSLAIAFANINENDKKQVLAFCNAYGLPYSSQRCLGKRAHLDDENHSMLINDFSFTAEPGQRVAIVGPTGAGKTTIVKLLMRFYELNGGCIRVDDHDIRDFSRADLRQMFGMVLQDTWLNSGTIRENIRYGRRDATDEEVEAAAKAAHIDHFIRTQPKGYDMEINEEANNISQGQKQLLTIARALLADTPIMILDEATSSVDTRTEALIQKAMATLMQGRTSFIIAHRLSTIKDADHILVMNHGDIIEQGTHESLLAQNGFYTNLYNSQFAE